MRPNAFTLLELLVVVVLLGLVAGSLILAPARSNADRELDAAAAEVAGAFRFARGEAIRTGAPHGVYASASSQRVRVYRLDTSASPPAPVYSVRHPLDKRLYDLQFGSHPILGSVVVEDVSFLFDGLATPTSYLGFDARGTPRYRGASGVHLLQSAAVRLGHTGRQRHVRVAAATGRVTVQ